MKGIKYFVYFYIIGPIIVGYPDTVHKYRSLLATWFYTERGYWENI